MLISEDGGVFRYYNTIKLHDMTTLAFILMLLYDLMSIILKLMIHGMIVSSYILIIYFDVYILE